MIVDGTLAQAHLATLGLKWYIDYTPDPRNAPPGTTKVPFVTIKPGVARLAPGVVRTYASEAPGTVWYLGGEPNVPTRGEISPQAFVAEFDYYVDLIKAADPTARITSPSILNWDFTCVACGGFTPGEQWMTDFIAAYRAAHGGQFPPIDIWAIDVYPLNWSEVPMTDWFTVTRQITGYRDFLDSEIPGGFLQPIWITEVASHWAYTAWELGPGGTPTLPAGFDWVRDYQWGAMEGYVTSLVDWLRLNAGARRIEKWFFYRDYVDLPDAANKYSYGGMYFLDSAAADASLNPLGAVYRDYATGVR